MAKVVRSARFFDRLGDVDIKVIKVDPPDAGQQFRAEMTTRSARHEVRAEGEGDTVEHALDAAADRFGHRLRRLRERMTERRRQRPRSPAMGDMQGGRPRAPTGPRDETPEIVRVRRPIRQADDPGGRRVDHEPAGSLVLRLHEYRNRSARSSLPAQRWEAGADRTGMKDEDGDRVGSRVPIAPRFDSMVLIRRSDGCPD